MFLVLQHAAFYCAYSAEIQKVQVTEFHCKMRKVLKFYIRERLNFLLLFNIQMCAYELNK